MRTSLDGSWKISVVASYTTGSSSPLPPVSAEMSPDIMKPVEVLLAEFSDPHWDVLAPCFLPGATCTLCRPPAPEPMIVTMEQSIERLRGLVDKVAPAVFQERVHAVQARTCGRLGFVWAPFVVEIGGKVQHEGVNIFSFLKKEEEDGDERWIFIGCQDFGKAAADSGS